MALKAAVIGTGYGVEHIQGLQQAGVEVVAVCSGKRENAERVARDYGIPHAFTDYRQALELPGLDMVTIATPPYLHEEMALAAIEAGLHVLCEKPLAYTSEQAERMTRRAEAAGICHMTNFCWRFFPEAFEMHRLIATGALGDLYHVNARYLSPSQFDPAVPWTWRDSKAKGGIGALGDLGVHLIDLVRWIAGDFAAVSSVIKRLITERTDPATGERKATELEDTATIQACIEGGIPALLHVSRCCVATRYMEVEVYGSKGGLRYTMDRRRRKAQLWGAFAGETEFRPLPVSPEFQGVGPSYAHFVEAVRHGIPPEPSFRDGWAAQLVVDAVQEAAASRQWVEPAKPR